MTQEDITVVEGLIEKALRDHERRCADDRHELERRLDYRIDKLERKLAYYAGGLAVISAAVQIFFS